MKHSAILQSRWRMLLILLALGVGLLLTRSYWLRLAGYFLVVSDPVQPVDAIVPLGGNNERIPYAAQLFHSGYAPLFVATDPADRGGDDCQSGDTIIQCIAIQNDVPRERIVVTSRPVYSTREEALALRELAQARQWQSLLVVTSSTHTRRSQMIFRYTFAGSGITVSIRPVTDDRYDPEHWWEDQYQRRQVQLEYYKMLGFLVARR